MLQLLSPGRRDTARSFSELQRKTVFFRDREVCQWCRMNGSSRGVPWDESEIHYVSPHGDGGSADVSNAALVHKECHPRSRVDVEMFRDWWYKKPGMKFGNFDLEQAGASSPAGPPTKSKMSLLPDGTEAKFKYDGQVHRGVIRGGKLALDAAHEGMVCKSFSEASRVVSGTSRNGWMDWHLCLPDEETWLLADDWRKGG